MYLSAISWDALEFNYFQPPAPGAIHSLEQLLPPRRVLEESGTLDAESSLRRRDSEIERAIMDSQAEIEDCRARFLADHAVRLVDAAAAETLADEERMDDDECVWHAIKRKLLRGAAFQDDAMKQQVRDAAEAFRASR